MKIICFCFSWQCLCGLLEMSYQNWLVVFEKNPLLWLIPYRFEKKSIMLDQILINKGIEWKLKLFK